MGHGKLEINQQQVSAVSGSASFDFGGAVGLAVGVAVSALDPIAGICLVGAAVAGAVGWATSEMGTDSNQAFPVSGIPNKE